MAKYTGGPFVGTRSYKIIAPGIVKYVMNVGIGGSGTAKSAISVPMGLLSLASIVEQEDEWGKSRLIAISFAYSFYDKDGKASFW